MAEFLDPTSAPLLRLEARERHGSQNIGGIYVGVYNVSSLSSVRQ